MAARRCPFGRHHPIHVRHHRTGRIRTTHQSNPGRRPAPPATSSALQTHPDYRHTPIDFVAVESGPEGYDLHGHDASVYGGGIAMLLSGRRERFSRTVSTGSYGKETTMAVARTVAFATQVAIWAGFTSF